MSGTVTIRMPEEATVPRTVTFRSFLAGDVVQLALQPSQHVTLGMHKAVHSIEDGRELEAMGPAWSAIEVPAAAPSTPTEGGGGRILACYGFGYQWPPSERTGGHALAWAMLGEGLGAAHVAITRFARETIAASPIDRIEAIVRKAVEAECRWAELVGFRFVAELSSWGPERETHLLYERVHGQLNDLTPVVKSGLRLEALGAV